MSHSNIHSSVCDSNKQKSSMYSSLENLSSQLEGLVNCKMFSDVVLVACDDHDSEEFFAHKAIICQRCPFFEHCLREGCWEEGESGKVKMDISPEVMKLVLVFLYTGKVSIYDEIVFGLLAASDKLDITDLRAHCTSYISATMNSQNIFQYLESAEELGIDELRQVTLQWVVSNAAVVFLSDSFLSIKVDTLVCLLKNDDILIEEDEIWRAVFRWGIRNCSIRSPNPENWSQEERELLKETLQPVFPLIRVLRISGDCWIDEVAPTELMPFELERERGLFAIAPHKYMDRFGLSRPRGRRTLFRWDSEVCPAYCRISNDQKSVSLVAQGASTTFAVPAVLEGIQIIHIRIDNIPVKTAYYVGISCAKSRDLCHRSLRDVGWGLQDNGRGLMHEGEYVGGEFGGRGCGFGNGDVVTMIVDKPGGFLMYLINGRPVARVEIPEIMEASEVNLGVTMYNNHAAMSILDTRTDYPDLDLEKALSLFGVSPSGAIVGNGSCSVSENGSSNNSNNSNNNSNTSSNNISNSNNGSNYSNAVDHLAATAARLNLNIENPSNFDDSP